MAHDNVEVEIKVELSSEQFKEIKNKISKIAKFIKASHHIDHYYNSPYLDFLKPQYPYEWLTLRERDGKVLLNYKHWYPEGIKDTTHADEYEAEISNKDSLIKLLSALKFKEFIIIDKSRETYVFEDKFEIALDEVKDLGYFMEVESLKNMGGPEKTHSQLSRFLNSLGIVDTHTIPGGYAAHMMRKKGIK